MLTSQSIRAAIPLALREVHLPGLGERHQGKVRDYYRLAGRRRLMVTTDRLSAFDRVLGVVPYKGQVLNQLSAFWFHETADIVPNHLLDVPDPNVAIVRECAVFPVEVIVRGYITGVTKTSLWYHYQRGERVIYGIQFPDGLQKNSRLPEPVITPTTKATAGGHDQRLTTREVVEHGLVAPDHWARICQAALGLYQHGQAVAAKAGLILVDTKYEFGLSPDGRVMLVDEVHTPDSSRFWRADTYDERLAAVHEPDNFDKEFVRLWFAGQGYRGDGPPPFDKPLDRLGRVLRTPPAMSEEIIITASRRYMALYEMLTGQVFEPAEYPAEPRIRASVKRET
jgi:phosphoribosylaminoimidazole-succinocarboxamide synthase